jgi:hypothetical protein
VTLRILLVDAPHLGGSAISTQLPGQRQGSGASQDTFFKDDPSIREEVLDSRLEGSVPRALRFFLSGFFGIFLPRLQMDPQPEPAAQPKARGLLHMECDFHTSSILAPASRQDGHFLKTFEGSTRGRLGLLEKTSRLLRHQLEYIPASGCFDYS